MPEIYEVLVYEGWGKTYTIEADSKEEAEAIYDRDGKEAAHVVLQKEQLNETFVVEVSE